jgi:hypothetical protein
MVSQRSIDGTLSDGRRGAELRALQDDNQANGITICFHRLGSLASLTFVLVAFLALYKLVRVALGIAGMSPSSLFDQLAEEF